MRRCGSCQLCKWNNKQLSKEQPIKRKQSSLIFHFINIKFDSLINFTFYNCTKYLLQMYIIPLLLLIIIVINLCLSPMWTNL